MNNYFLLLIFISINSYGLDFPLASNDTVVIYINRLGVDEVAYKQDVDDINTMIVNSNFDKKPRVMGVENQSTSLFIDMLEEYELKAKEAKTDANYIEEKAFEFFSEYFFTPPRFRFNTVDPEYKESYDNIRVLYEPRQDQIKTDIIREKVKKVQRENRVILLTHQQSTRMANEIISKNIAELERPVWFIDKGIDNIFYKRIGNLMLTPFVNELNAFDDTRKKYILHDKTSVFDDFVSLLDETHKIESTTTSESDLNLYLSSGTVLDDGTLMRDVLVSKIEGLVIAVNEDNFCFSSDELLGSRMYLSPANVVSDKFIYIHTEIENNREELDNYTLVGVAKGQDLDPEYSNFFMLENWSNLKFDDVTFLSTNIYYDFISLRDANREEKQNSQNFEYHIVKKSDIYRFLSKKPTECSTFKLNKNEKIFFAGIDNELDPSYIKSVNEYPIFQFKNLLPLDVVSVSLNNQSLVKDVNGTDYNYISTYEAPNILNSLTIDVQLENFAYSYKIELPKVQISNVDFVRETDKVSTWPITINSIELSVGNSPCEGGVSSSNFYCHFETQVGNGFVFVKKAQNALPDDGGVEIDPLGRYYLPQNIYYGSFMQNACYSNAFMIPVIVINSIDGCFSSLTGFYDYESVYEITKSPNCLL